MWIADLHIHSKYSRATSAQCDIPHLDLWARRKGIQLVGTGDFTHPKWREEMRQQLEPADEGVYRLKKEYILPCKVPCAQEPRFVISGEISTIYKRDGKTRKVHHVVLLPSLEAAERLSGRLEAIGNLHSDGRPILGLDSRDLLEIILESCPDAIYIPAHIWTPHFSLFGAFSGFDSIEECYGDLSSHIHALETGLSSDPPMNRLLSALDGHLLVSNSDAHSPAKLGREANFLSCPIAYPTLKKALETGEGFEGTLEFFPEEGKYHLDGHRACQCRLDPEETLSLGGRCPVCGKKITIGVLSRVMTLADRKTPGPLERPFESLIPLGELLGETLGVSAESKKAQTLYFDLLERLGPELHILRETALEEAEKAGGALFAEALRRMRQGQVIRRGGYDGEYGVIRVFSLGEKETLTGQTTWLNDPVSSEKEEKHFPRPDKQDTKKKEEKKTLERPGLSLNPEQLQAVEAEEETVAVIAGPGTGKTGTLVARIAWLIEEKGISPREITAVTFTHQAAKEMAIRLNQRLGKETAGQLRIGTFHSIALTLIEKKPLISRENARRLMKELLISRGEALDAGAALQWVSAWKNALNPPQMPSWLPEAYQEVLEANGLRDLDDILLEALAADTGSQGRFHYLLVDEYQDINPIQRKLTVQWARNNHLFIIGDPDQSIYGFRGAAADCFEALTQIRPGARLIRFRQNYRSTPAILDCALRVIGHNPGGKRLLIPTIGKGKPVRMAFARDEMQQGIWISKEIARLTGGVDMLEAKTGERAQYAFSEIAVLCRTHQQLERIEKCLRHDDIPCAVSIREEDLSSERCMALTGFFAALLDRADLASLRLALKGLWNYPESLIEQAEEAFARPGGKNGTDFCDALRQYDAFSPFLSAVEKLLPLTEKEPPRRLLSALAEEAGTRGKDVDTLLNTAVFYEDMRSFLDALRQGEEGDITRISGGKPSGAVKLMTLHAAKGLEFPVVFVAGINQDVLPMERKGEETNEQEERRLFFVGITRARQELILSCCASPSPFLKDLEDITQTVPCDAPHFQEAFRQISFLD